MAERTNSKDVSTTPNETRRHYSEIKKDLEFHLSKICELLEENNNNPNKMTITIGCYDVRELGDFELRCELRTKV